MHYKFAGGHAVISMRELLVHIDPEFVKIQPLIQKLADEGKVELAEDYVMERFYAGFDGHMFAFKKIE